MTQCDTVAAGTVLRSLARYCTRGTQAGGGVFIGFAGSLTNVSIYGAQATDSGGAVFIAGSGSLTDVTIDRASAAYVRPSRIPHGQPFSVRAG